MYDGKRSPIRLDLFVTSDFAARFGLYPSCFAAANTAFLVSSVHFALPLNTFDTVVLETPATFATSLTVTLIRIFLFVERSTFTSNLTVPLFCQAKYSYFKKNEITEQNNDAPSLFSAQRIVSVGDVLVVRFFRSQSAIAYHKLFLGRQKQEKCDFLT